MVIAVAVVKVNHAGVLTLCDCADLTSLLIVGWRDWRFGTVVDGFEKGALISCFRAGDNFDILAGGDADGVPMFVGLLDCESLCT